MHSTIQACIYLYLSFQFDFVLSFFLIYFHIPSIYSLNPSTINIIMFLISYLPIYFPRSSILCNSVIQSPMHLYFPVSFSIYFHLSSILYTQSSNHPCIYIFISNLCSIFVSRSSYALNHSCIHISISNWIFSSFSSYFHRSFIHCTQPFNHSFIHIFIS